MGAIEETPVREYVAIWGQATEYGYEPRLGKPRVAAQYYAERFRAHSVQDVIEMWKLLYKQEHVSFEAWKKLLGVEPFEAGRHDDWLLPPRGPAPRNEEEVAEWLRP